MGDAKESLTKRHPIRVVATRTGLSPDVLRIWERRYGTVHPSRSSGGQRLYSDADIERLVLLDRATRAGRPISQVAELTDREVERLLAADDAARARRAAEAPEQIGDATAVAALDAALSAIRALDAPALELSLRSAALKLGAEPFITRVLAPLLGRIGEDWEAGALGIAHEHAASPVVRRLLEWIAATFSVPDQAPVVVIATPAGERHEFGAMLAGATAAGAGWRATYLGSDLPAADIARAARQTGARCVALSLVHGRDAAALATEVEMLRRALGDEVPVVVGGDAVSGLPRAVRQAVHVATGLPAFADLLGRLAPALQR
jgi:DNA-binding transcriptional MerR regulator/methylmalonyl-CoA mutase cobalamin-binding subunit